MLRRRIKHAVAVRIGHPGIPYSISIRVFEHFIHAAIAVCIKVYRDGTIIRRAVLNHHIKLSVIIRIQHLTSVCVRTVVNDGINNTITIGIDRYLHPMPLRNILSLSIDYSL